VRVAHIGDTHIGLNYPGPTPESRFNDITRVLDWCGDRIIEENCELVLIAGDMFKDARVFLDRASREITAAAKWLRRLTGAGCQVVMISGTPSHDAIAAYQLLREMQIDGLTIATEPTVITIPPAVRVACLPGTNRAAWASKEEYKHLPPQQIHQIMTDEITETCRNMKAEILLGHLTYDLADKGFEDVLMQHEPLLTTEAIEGYHLVALGHIHRPQRNGNVFYCGSPERLTFNDEHVTPGFWIYEYEGRGPYPGISARFIETPARRHLTIDWDAAAVQTYLDTGRVSWPFIADSIVRLRYGCPDTMAKQINRRALEAAIYEAGAYYVSEILGAVTESTRDRDQKVTAEMGVIDALQMWCDQPEIGIKPEEVPALLAMAGELLQGGTSE